MKKLFSTFALLALLVANGTYASELFKSAQTTFAVKALKKIQLEEGGQGVVGVEESIIDSSAAWGVINIFKDNSLGVAYQKSRGVDGFEATVVDIYLARSVDNGKTWTKKLVAEAPLPLLRKDGLLEFSQLRNLSMGQLSSGEIIIAFSKLVHVKQKTGEGVIQNKVNKSAFRNDGLYSVISKDMGSTFSSPLEIKVSEMLYPTTHYKILNIDGVGLLMSVYGYDEGYKDQVVGILISPDGGKHWSFRKIDTMHTPPYGETSLLYFNNVLFAQIRNEGDFLSQYYSVDFGETWTGPEVISS